MKSSFCCGNARDSYDPNAGDQPVLVQAKNFPQLSPDPIANDCLTDSPRCDDSQPSSAFACPVQYPQGDVPSDPGFSVFLNESEFGCSS
jgi:hypothetical protein